MADIQRQIVDTYNSLRSSEDRERLQLLAHVTSESSFMLGGNYLEYTNKGVRRDHYTLIKISVDSSVFRASATEHFPWSFKTH
jgi:hypothetical protein